MTRAPADAVTACSPTTRTWEIDAEHALLILRISFELSDAHVVFCFAQARVVVLKLISGICSFPWCWPGPRLSHLIYIYSSALETVRMERRETTKQDLSLECTILYVKVYATHHRAFRSDALTSAGFSGRFYTPKVEAQGSRAPCASAYNSDFL